MKSGPPRASVTLIPEDGLVRPAEVHAAHTEEDWSHILRALSVSRLPDGAWLLQRKERFAGLVTVGDEQLYSPPAVSLPSFLSLILIAYNLDRALSGDEVESVSGDAQAPESILELLSTLMTAQAGRLAAGHIAQGYVARRDRLSLLRGRPVWLGHRPRPADGTLLCDYQLKSTDIALNQAVLAGVSAAAWWLRPLRERRQARTQRFVWSSLAEPVVPTRELFARARRSINRLTVGYRPAVDLAELLVFGLDPLAAPHEVARALPAPLFDLAYLFEALMLRALRLLAEPQGLRVYPQVTYTNAVVDATGSIYRRARPDLVIWRGQTPVAVIDAKFKPRYVRDGPGLGRENRVTSADIYQLFFYAERLKKLYEVEELPAFIIAPKLKQAMPPALAKRKIFWSSEAGPTASLAVLDADVEAVTKAVMDRDGDAVAEGVPDLQLVFPALAHM